MSHPLFSIITVTWNAIDTIGPTVRSVGEQTFTDFEHIIIDGASTDGTIDYVGAHSDSTRTTIISEPDKGIYDAMNKGLERANGEYVIFLNAGDSFHSPTTLATIAAAAEEDRPGIIYGQTQIVDSERRRIADRHLTAPPRLTLDSFADGMVVCHQAFVALTKITSPFNLQYRYSADYEWCIRCLQHSRKNVCIDGIMIDYLMEGVTTANRRRSLLERFRIMSRYYGLPTALRKHLRFIPRFVRRSLLERRLTK